MYGLARNSEVLRRRQSRYLNSYLEDFDEVNHEYKRRPADKPVDYALMLLPTPTFVRRGGLPERSASATAFALDPGWAPAGESADTRRIMYVRAIP
jgi:hypothetical protein